MHKTQENMLDILDQITKWNHPDESFIMFAKGVIQSINAHPDLNITPTTDEGMFGYADQKGRRFMTTLGRLLTRQLGYDAVENALMIQRLSDAYASVDRRASAKIDIVYGDEIARMYCIEWGGHTCMTMAEQQPIVKFYAVNPNIGMVRFAAGKTRARALLWKTNAGLHVMDRIYPNDGWHIMVMQEWAKKNGFVFRKHNSLPDYKTDVSDDEAHYATVNYHFIQSDTVCDTLWPYMDTFRWGAPLKNRQMKLSNDPHALHRQRLWWMNTTYGKKNLVKRCQVCDYDMVTNHKFSIQIFDQNSKESGRAAFCCYACYVDQGSTLTGRHIAHCPTCNRLFMVPNGWSNVMCPKCASARKAAEEIKVANPPKDVDQMLAPPAFPSQEYVWQTRPEPQRTI